jgi:carbon-monoxide dehydrogenase medium subunit
VKPAPFVHHAPRTVEEAVAVLAEVGHDGKVLAGGQSLIPILNMRLASPGHLVDINRIAGLDFIEVAADHVRVGALVRHAGLERADEAYAAHPILRQATVNVAHPAIRNRGTVVGSIAHADAAGEMPAIVALTDGVVEVAGPRGTREIGCRQFFLGALETSLEPDELATAVRFGRFPVGTGTAFGESARRHGDYALAGVAASVTVTDGIISRALTSFVSVTDVPVYLDLTDVLAGAEPQAADWGAACDAVRTFVEPYGDIHATAEYRRMLAGELARRVLAEAAANATPTSATSPTNAALVAERTGIPLSSATNGAFGARGTSDGMSEGTSEGTFEGKNA